MRSAKLRHRVTIQAKTTTADGYGGTVETWADVSGLVLVAASVEPLQGRELVNAQAVFAETTTRFTLRYRAGITPAHRIAFGGKVYNIHGLVDLKMKHLELVIMASEGLNEG